MHVFLKTAYVLGDTSTHPQVYFIVIIIFFLISHGVDVIKSLFRCKFYHFKCIWRLLEVSPQTLQTVFKKIWICRNTCMLFCQFGLLTTFTKINKRGDLNKVRGDRKWEVNVRRGWVGGLKLWTSTFLFYFFKENWICAMSRHHAEPNINYIMDKKSRCWLWRQQKGRSGRMGYSESERSRSKEDRAWMILKKWTFFMPVICVSYLKPLFIFLT